MENGEKLTPNEQQLQIGELNVKTRSTIRTNGLGVPRGSQPRGKGTRYPLHLWTYSRYLRTASGKSFTSNAGPSITEIYDLGTMRMRCMKLSLA